MPPPWKAKRRQRGGTKVVRKFVRVGCPGCAGAGKRFIADPSGMSTVEECTMCHGSGGLTTQAAHEEDDA